MEHWTASVYFLEFASAYTDDLTASTFEASLYNLTDATIKTLKIGRGLGMHGGYGALPGKSDQGVYGHGRITGVETKWAGADKITTVYGSNYGTGTAKTVEKSYGAGVASGQILRWLCEEVGAPIAKFTVLNNRVFPEAVTVEGDINKKIEEYAKMCGVWAYMVDGLLYVQDMKLDPKRNIFILNEFSGLLDAPTPFTEEVRDTRSEEREKRGATVVYEGYNLKTLINHRLRPGVGVELTARGRRGRYLVRNVKHTYDGVGGVTEAKVLDTVNGRSVAT